MGAGRTGISNQLRNLIHYQHNSGIVSMARGDHKDSAGSQFFIVHKDSPHLDGKYTVFGRLVPGLPNALEHIASLETDDNNAPLDLLEARIITAKILEPYTSANISIPDRNQSHIEKETRQGGVTDVYYNSLHNVSFDLPYRWLITEATGKTIWCYNRTYMPWNITYKLR